MMDSRNANSKDGATDAPYVDVSGIYPDYFMHNDHFEADQWLSSSAVNAYDFKSEAIYAGAYDAMMRQMLVPIHFWMAKSERSESELSILEVGGGTGRLMSFFRDNYPKASASLLELSPYMLEKAGKTDEYFRRWFKRSDQRQKVLYNFEMSPLKLQ